MGERGHALLEMTFRALHRISMDPWRIGKIVTAALALLHLEHHRTTPNSDQESTCCQRAVINLLREGSVLVSGRVDAVPATAEAARL